MLKWLMNVKTKALLSAANENVYINLCSNNNKMVNELRNKRLPNTATPATPLTAPSTPAIATTAATSTTATTEKKQLTATSD